MRRGMALRVASLVAAYHFVACSWSSPTTPVSDTDAGIPCPGLQCPCPCSAPLTCGPHNACTKPCATATDCGGTPGETCLAGLCGVVCDPGGLDDCGAVGMASGACLTLMGTAVCGYPPEDAAADETGPEK